MNLIYKVITITILTLLINSCSNSTPSDKINDNNATDTERPVITLNGTSNIVLNIGENYTDAGATATDNIDGDITGNILTVNSVDTTKAGTYTVTYNVKDTANNNAVEIVRTVKVNEIINNTDTEKPVITLNGESNIVLNVGENYTDAGATATDNIDGDITGNILTVNSVDTTKAGTYTVTYNVKDTANNNAVEIVRTVKVNENTNNIGINYEDAENQKTDKWRIISNDSNKATILNTYDDETNSRVIYLDATIKDGQRKSYDTFEFNGINKKQSNQFLQWSMKFPQTFRINVNISTDKGRRWLHYIPKDTGAGRQNDTITLGIGSNTTNNQWHTVTRDLNLDLQRYEADNSFTKINYITIRGGGYVDNITSYSKDDNLEINKPVVVSKPGIVFTFDDSYIENWNEMQSTFKEKGVVVTFFCYRWASNQNWNLPDDQINLLKIFRDNGHEIAYHTSDHINTRDHKYDNEPNKAQAYLDDQIIPGIEYMRNKGFEPTSFSYPYMSEQPAHNILIRKELPHIRTFFAHVTITDDPGNISLDEIRTHLEKLKREKDIGVFLSHWILYKDANESHKYQISKEKLVKIIDMVNELGLEFYTLSEAHNIYMNQ